ncbi:uncharacterized protein LOC144624772 [Crassostrea virginica]
MATSTSWAQDVIICDLCDKPTQQFCNSCQVSLCDTCIKKHRDEFKSLIHEIVPFLERKIQLVFPECPHKGHDVEELTEIHENKVRKIKSDTEEIKANIIPKYQNEDQNIVNTISKTKSKIDHIGRESKRLRKLWHQEVDNIFDKIDSLSQSLGEENLNALQDKGKELSIEIGGFRATLKHMSQPNLSTDVSRLATGIGKLMDKVGVIATIPTTYSSLFGVACVGGAEAWIYGNNKTITRIDIYGSVKDTVKTTCQYRPGGISVTRGRELVYSDYVSRTVNIVRDEKSEILITTPRGWTPRRLSCTRSGDILVQVYNCHHSYHL